jgi:hypothetical protein
LSIVKHINNTPENRKPMAVFIFIVVLLSRIVFNAKTSNNQPAITVSAKTIVNRLTAKSIVGLFLIDIVPIGLFCL